MPRGPRIRLPGYPAHVIQRGHNRNPCFVNDNNRVLYLALLEELSRSEGCGVHAYVLMPNHVHLLVTPRERESLSEMMRKLGQRYVQHFNRVFKRTGSLWEGRFRSCIVDSDTYFLRCQRYIELNPVRAAIVQRPSEFVWSSYGVNGLGERSEMIESHPAYLALARDPAVRRVAYRHLFKADLTNAELAEIRDACNGGFALGSKEFVAELERITGRRVAPARATRNAEEICP